MSAATQFKVWDYGADYQVTEASPTPHAEFLRQAIRPTPSPLDKFRDLSAGWDGRGAVPPNRFALSAADYVLALCPDWGLSFDRIVAIPDGGLAIYFFGSSLTPAGAHRLVARLAFGNDAAKTLLLEDVESGESSLTDEETSEGAEDILERIRSHISR